MLCFLKKEDCLWLWTVVLLALIAPVYCQEVIGSNTNTTANSTRITLTEQQQSASLKLSSIVREEYGIVKPKLDDRNYVHITLSNGLEALLISDNSTDKSAASLDLRVGQMADPVPGLAHFLEHMLFLGTKKYPNESEFNEFITKNGGNLNAYTAPANTNYYFDVVPEKLEDALDRFAQFFIEPLFSEELIDREMNAVHSEYHMNLQNDGWRAMHLFKQIVNPLHPFSKFGIGNLDTLRNDPSKRNITIRQELIDFFEKYYSANLMKLCVIGKEPLDVLKQYVIELFGAVPNRHTIISSWAHVPLIPKMQLKKWIKFVPIRDLKCLTITFPVPYNESQLYTRKPLRYASHILDHGGKGSLDFFLKQKGWIVQSAAGLGNLISDQAIFTIEFDLTDQGEEHILEIVEYSFRTLQMLRNAGPQQALFEELKNIDAASFLFSDKGHPISTVSVCAHAMHTFPAHHILNGDAMVSEFDSGLIQDYLSYLVPDNMIVFYQSKLIEREPDLKTEQWFNVLYSEQHMNETWATSLLKLDIVEGLSIPPRNPFIAEQFDLQPRVNVTLYPEPIIKGPCFFGWWKQDEQFEQPKAATKLAIELPGTFATPHTYLLANLYVSLLSDELVSFAYDAQVAKFHYSVALQTAKLMIDITGFDEKLQILQQQIVERLFNFELKQDQFKVKKQQLRKDLLNSQLNSPRHMGWQKIQQALFLYSHSPEDLLAVLDSISLDDLQCMKTNWRKSTRITALFHGNVNKTQAMHWSNQLSQVLCQNCTPLGSHQLFENRVIQLAPGTTVWTIPHPNSNETNSYCHVAHQIGITSPFSYTVLLLLVQILKTPHFEQLRTVEQLGYGVWLYSYTLDNVDMLGSVILSNVHDPHYLLNRSDTFLMEQAENLLHQITDTMLLEHKQALQRNLREKPKHLEEQTNEFWEHILDQNYRFNYNEQLANYVENIGRQELIQFYDRHINPRLKSNIRRLVVQVFTKQHEHKISKSCKDEKEEGDTAQLIEDLHVFKRNSSLYPKTFSRT